MERRRRVLSAARRARPGRARRPARLRLRVGGRAPLPRRVLALVRARGVPRRGGSSHDAHPARPRHPPGDPEVQPPGAHRRGPGHARPDLRRPRRLRHRRRGDPAGAARLRHPRQAEAGDGARGRRADRQHDGARPVPRLRRPRRSRCRAATCCPSRARSRTRRCGWRAPTATRSRSPPATASARWRSASSIPTRRSRGSTCTTTSSSSDECVPLGHTVNANIALVTGFSLHEDRAEAIRRGQEGFEFFGYALERARRARSGAGAHRPVGRVPGAPLPRQRRAQDRCGRRAGRLVRELHRHARGRGALPAPDARRRRRPGDLHPAGGPQPPRGHLLVARAVRRPT